jgi:hypothetical protein
MNWKLVLALSGFGLAMGIATVFVIPSKVEPLFWLVIFVVCAIVIAKRAPGRHFLHGFSVSLVNSLWITTAHIAFFDHYVASHPQEAEMMNGMPIAGRAAMALTGPIVGLVSGLVLGLFSFLASKITKPAAS